MTVDKLYCIDIILLLLFSTYKLLVKNLYHLTMVQLQQVQEQLCWKLIVCVVFQCLPIIIGIGNFY